MAKNTTRKANPYAEEGFSLIRPKYKARNGDKRISRTWHVWFKDCRGKWRRLAGFTDKTATERFARKLVKLVGYRATNDLPDAVISKWVDELPDAVRDKLIAWDILDRRAGAASEELSGHIEAWWKSIVNNGRTFDHADLVKTHVEKIVDRCSFGCFNDIDELAVQEYLANSGLSVQTRNHYVRAIKQFCRWMVEYGRASRSPVAGLKMLNAKADPKHERRALSPEQFRTLIETTRSGPVRGHMTGPERAMLYTLAAHTGLRAGALRALRASDFDLDAKPPVVKVRAAVRGNKAKKRVALRLSADLVAQLREHLRNKLPSAPAFKMPTKQAMMLRFDLERAGLPYRDPDTGEYFDFHSLRVQTGTDLARGGAHPKAAQQRMRHSRIDLTMDIYTKLGLDEQDDALDALAKIAAGA